MYKLETNQNLVLKYNACKAYWKDSNSTDRHMLQVVRDVIQEISRELRNRGEYKLLDTLQGGGYKHGTNR